MPIAKGLRQQKRRTGARIQATDGPKGRSPHSQNPATVCQSLHGVLSVVTSCYNETNEIQNPWLSLLKIASYCSQGITPKMKQVYTETYGRI